MLVFLFWFFVAPAALMALYSVRTGKRYLEHVEGALKNPPAEFTPPVSLIVPVKGLDYGLASNLRSLAQQDYPDFELLIVCASASDEALRVARASLDPSVRVITAGLPPSGTGEKIHNLLEAVRLARQPASVGISRKTAASGRCCEAFGTPPSPGPCATTTRTSPGAAARLFAAPRSTKPAWRSSGRGR